MTRGWGADVLGGTRVVELSSGIAGNHCARSLAAAGAHVLKVEDPAGDPLGRRSPIAPPGSSPAGALFGYLAQSRESLIVDPGAAADLAALDARLAEADVVIWSPGSSLMLLDALHPLRIRSRHPQAIVCAITPFGLTGPWVGKPATELTLQAWGGSIGHRGEPDGTPVQAGGRLTEWTGGTMATAAVLTSRMGRAARGGAGELLDVSLLECAATFCAMAYPVTYLSMEGRPMRAARGNNLPNIHPAKDGWGGFMVITGQQWLDFCLLVQHPEWMADESLLLMENRLLRREELTAAIDEWMGRHTLAEVLELAADLRVPAAVIANGRSVPELLQVREQSMVERGPDGMLQPVPPYRFSEGLPPPAARPAPDLRRRAALPGSRQSAAASGASHPRVVQPPGSADTPGPQQSTPAAKRPLEGLRVADLTAFWAGPTAGRYLAIMGADVIRVESHIRLDGFRMTTSRAFTGDLWWEWAAMVDAINVGKRHLGLDLSSKAGRDVLLRLVERCDVLMENYTPRVLENFGISVEQLHEVNPRLVVMRMPAFGLKGPWRERPGYAQVMEMFSGMSYVTGFPDGPPMLPNGSVDPIGGIQAVVALLLALETRGEAGSGMLVESPLLTTALGIAAEPMVEFSRTGNLVERLGNRDPMFVPQGVYRCAPAEEDRWVAISVDGDGQWVALRKALGEPDWARNRALDTTAGRWAAHDEIDAHLVEWCARRSADEVVSCLWGQGIPVGKVIMPHEQGQVVQLEQCGFFQEVSHPLTGTHPHATLPVRFSSMSGPVIPRPNPMVGQHNREVLRDVAGLTSSEIDALERDGVIGTGPPDD